MPESTTPITYPDSYAAAAAMYTMPAGAVVAVYEQLFFKSNDADDIWTGVDCEYTADDVAALGPVERIDHLPDMVDYLESLALAEAEAKERHEDELAEWREAIAEAKATYGV